MKDMEWRNENMECIGPYVPLLLLWCSSCWLVNNIFKVFPFLSLYIYIYWKQLVRLQEAFILASCFGSLKRGFHPEILLFYFLFFFNTIGPPQEVFNSTVGLRCLMEVFTRVSLFFFYFYFFLFSRTWWGRSWDLFHHHHCLTDSIDEFLFWQGIHVDL